MDAHLRRLLTLNNSFDNTYIIHVKLVLADFGLQHGFGCCLKAEMPCLSSGPELDVGHGGVGDES